MLMCLYATHTCLELTHVVELHWDDETVGTLVTAVLLVAEVRDDVALHLVVQGTKCGPIDWRCQWQLKAIMRSVHIEVKVMVQVGIIWMDAMFWFDGVQH